MGIIGTPQMVADDDSIDQQYYRSGTETYRVFATTDYTSVLVRQNFPTGIYSVRAHDAGQLVSKIDVKREYPFQCAYDSLNNPGGADPAPTNGTACFVWLVTVSYGPWIPFENTTTGEPADQPIQVFYEGQTYQEPCEVDINGNPVVNSAYDPFDPPVVRDRTRPIIRVIQNINSFSASSILEVADKVNSDTVGPYAPKTLKVSAPRATLKYSQYAGTTYYEVEFIFTYNPDTWDAKPLDQGMNQLDPTNTYRRKILVEGQPATNPILLDGSGHMLPPPVTSANANYLDFQVYETIIFGTTFNFPTGTFT